jgi:hypothetical protein
MAKAHGEPSRSARGGQGKMGPCYKASPWKGDSNANSAPGKSDVQIGFHPGGTSGSDGFRKVGP